MLKETREEFKEKWDTVHAEGGGREKFIILVHKKGFKDQQLIVFFPEENKRVGVKPIRVLAERMDEKRIKEAILVVKQPLTPLAEAKEAGQMPEAEGEKESLQEFREAKE